MKRARIEVARERARDGEAKGLNARYLLWLLESECEEGRGGVSLKVPSTVMSELLLYLAQRERDQVEYQESMRQFVTLG